MGICSLSMNQAGFSAGWFVLLDFQRSCYDMFAPHSVCCFNLPNFTWEKRLNFDLCMCLTSYDLHSSAALQTAAGAKPTNSCDSLYLEHFPAEGF